ncbi:MAG: ATP-binding protein [Lachnospiraceae bacterium]|nr:ATP-binding protein [Lachnospiraceae bacterium]
MREKELLLYRNFEDGQLLTDMAWLMTEYANEFYNMEDKKALAYDCVSALLELAASHGFYGNIWHCYLANLMVNNENAYSTACEIVGPVEGTINVAALHDFEIFREFYQYDFNKLIQTLDLDCFGVLWDYQAGERTGKVYNTRIRDRICTIASKLATADTALEMKDIMTQFYKEYGVGRFGLHKAFRVEHTDEGAVIEPILNIQHVYLEDLVGYEIAKKKLIDNTEAFVNGKRANNCLLFGDAGTGKSSSIKGILNRYYDKGLRIIEIYKHQFKDLNDVISQIKNRNYKFIIYMDDLSFEEFEIEYKYLKAVIEGGLEKKPNNVLIYATSNRRHLIKESFKDKADRDEDLHTNDTVQEKLSLYARFGVTIFFSAPDKKEFQNIVKTLAERHNITMPEEELLLEANKWELSHGGLSGRTAQQFIDYLLGK